MRVEKLNESVVAARDRLVEENERLRKELVQAHVEIHRLNRRHVHYAHDGKQPLVPGTSIGIVQCPKCGQMMEVMK